MNTVEGNSTGERRLGRAASFRSRLDERIAEEIHFRVANGIAPREGVLLPRLALFDCMARHPNPLPVLDGA
jgi:hypothetical protein